MMIALHWRRQGSTGGKASPRQKGAPRWQGGQAETDKQAGSRSKGERKKEAEAKKGEQRERKRKEKAKGQPVLKAREAEGPRTEEATMPGTDTDRQVLCREQIVCSVGKHGLWLGFRVWVGVRE